MSAIIHRHRGAIIAGDNRRTAISAVNCAARASGTGGTSGSRSAIIHRHRGTIFAGDDRWTAVGPRYRTTGAILPVFAILTGFTILAVCAIFTVLNHPYGAILTNDSGHARIGIAHHGAIGAIFTVFAVFAVFTVFTSRSLFTIIHNPCGAIIAGDGLAAIAIVFDGA